MGNGNRRTWQLPSWIGGVRIVRRLDVEPEDDWKHFTSYRTSLEQWLRDPAYENTLSSMFEALAGYRPSFRGGETKLVVARLSKAFETDELVVIWEEPLAVGGSGGSQTSPAPAPTTSDDDAARSEKTWVEFELIDMDGTPVPNERYSVRLPDGRVVKGNLDKNGSLRISNIDPGTCYISFPDIDAREWRPA